MKTYKKSKIAYLFFLIIMMSIAAYDQLMPQQEQVQIVLKNQPQSYFSSEMIATNQ